VETISIDFDAPKNSVSVGRSLEQLGWQGVWPDKQINILINELVRYAPILGLTSHCKPDQICAKHVWEAAILALLVGDDFSGEACDLGTGNGFPGLALAALLPNASFALFESGRNRSAYLLECIAAMKIGNATVVNVHLGTPPPEHTERYHLISHRGFARLGRVIELSAFLGSETHFIAGFGSGISSRIESSRHNYRIEKKLDYRTATGNKGLAYLLKNS